MTNAQIRFDVRGDITMTVVSKDGQEMHLFDDDLETITSARYRAGNCEHAFVVETTRDDGRPATQFCPRCENSFYVRLAAIK